MPQIPIPLKRKRISHPIKAYRKYKKKRPSSLPFDKFMTAYAALAGTRAGYRRIGKAAKINAMTAARIDSDFRIRSRELREEIVGEEKGRGKRLEEVVSPEYIADVMAMLRRKGKAAMTYTAIAAQLRSKYGRGERHTVVQIAEMCNRARTKETARGIASRVAARATQKVGSSRFEKLLLATERAIDPATGKEIERMKYSMPEIAQKLGLSIPDVHARWRRHYLDGRTEAANNEVANRKRAENIAKALANPTKEVAAKLLEKGVKDDEVIIGTMMAFDRKTGATKRTGRGKGQQRNRNDYLELLRRAKKEASSFVKKSPVSQPKWARLNIPAAPKYKPLGAVVEDSKLARRYSRKPRLFSGRDYAADSPERILEAAVRRGRNPNDLEPLANNLVMRASPAAGVRDIFERRAMDAVARLREHYNGGARGKIALEPALAGQIDRLLISGYNIGAVLDRTMINRNGRSRTELKEAIEERRRILQSKHRLPKF